VAERCNQGAALKKDGNKWGGVPNNVDMLPCKGLKRKCYRLARFLLLEFSKLIHFTFYVKFNEIQ